MKTVILEIDDRFANALVIVAMGTDNEKINCTNCGLKIKNNMVVKIDAQGNLKSARTIKEIQEDIEVVENDICELKTFGGSITQALYDLEELQSELRIARENN